MVIPCRVGNYNLKCKLVWALNAPPPAWVLLPPQLEYYYPPSLSTTTPPSLSITTPPAWVLLPPQLSEFCTELELIPWLVMKLVTRKDCCILSRRRRGGVDHALSLSISFTEPGLFYILLSVLDWFGAWCYRTTLSRCHPPRYCDIIEKLVVDDGIKTLDLHLCATCMVEVLLIFIASILGLHFTVYAGSLILSR